MVKVIGYEEIEFLFPRIAFHEGNHPALHEVNTIKCGSNVKYNCNSCMYHSNKCGPYYPEVDKLQDL